MVLNPLPTKVSPLSPNEYAFSSLSVEGSMFWASLKLLWNNVDLCIGGVFKLELFLPEEYPMVAPKIRFLTKIYHPNIDKLGRICMDTLKGIFAVRGALAVAC